MHDKETKWHIIYYEDKKGNSQVFDFIEKRKEGEKAKVLAFLPLGELQMKTLRSHLRESLKDSKFKELYEEEKELLEVSLRLQEERKKAGLSQKDLAAAAHLTQQQVSKVENGENCNIMTYLKASRAIGLKLKFSRPRRQFARA